MSKLDIVKIRTAMGATQEQFAKIIGVSRRTVAAYEAGSDIPESRLKLINMLVDNMKIQDIKDKSTIQLKEKSETNTIEEPNSEYISQEGNDDLVAKLHVEIEFLKDHIKTLKEFVIEKTKLSELYEKSNNDLRATISILEEQLKAFKNGSSE